MAQNDEILAQELGRLGGIGSKWVARKLPNNGYEMSAKVKATAEIVMEYGERVLASQGTLRPEIVESATVPAVAAIVGSGFFNLNPTIVTIEVSATSNEQRQKGQAQQAGMPACRQAASHFRHVVYGDSIQETSCARR